MTGPVTRVSNIGLSAGGLASRSWAQCAGSAGKNQIGSALAMSLSQFVAPNRPPWPVALCLDDGSEWRTDRSTVLAEIVLVGVEIESRLGRAWPTPRGRE